MANLFVYGTLMVPAVMLAVTGRSFRSEPATLAGYTRYRIKRRVYPGIIATDYGFVDGLLYYDVDEQSMLRLDAFESNVYQRRDITVQLADEGEVAACTYVTAPLFEHLLSKDDWDLVQFEQRHLEHYLAGI